MTAPITADERAAMRETVATLDAAWEADDPTRPLVTEHATLTLLAHVASAVPRLLDALDTAEAERDEARAAIARRRALWEHERAKWNDALALDRRDRDEARAEVARLRDEAARPAPVWDEDTVTEAVARAMFPHFFTDDRQPLRVFTETRSDAELWEAERESARRKARQALAVVREHLPVRPDREAIADVLMSDWHGEYTCECQTDRCPSLPCPTSTPSYVSAADAVLDLWPGESRATVQAEALRDAGRWLVSIGYVVDLAFDTPAPAALWDAFVDAAHEDADGTVHGNTLTRAEVDDWLRAVAGRLAAEGADHG